MRYLLLLLIGLLLLNFPVWSQIQPARGFEQTAMDATFALYAQWDDHELHKTLRPFLCTAAAIQADDTGYILLTAGHCAMIPENATFFVREGMGKPAQPVTVISARREGQDDYMLLHLKTKAKYATLDLGDESSEAIGDTEINPNFTYGITKQLAHGIIASDIIQDSPICRSCEGGFLLHEFAAGGASGSPVISLTTHRVIGIVLAVVTDSGMEIEPISNVKAAFRRPNQYPAIQHPSEDSPFSLIGPEEPDDDGQAIQ